MYSYLSTSVKDSEERLGAYLMNLADQIPEDWRAVLTESIESATFQALELELVRQQARTELAIYPPEDLVFKALRLRRSTPSGR